MNKTGVETFLDGVYSVIIALYIYYPIYIYIYIYIYIDKTIYRQIPLCMHDYLTNSIWNVSLATDEGPSQKLATSEGGSRGNIES